MLELNQSSISIISESLFADLSLGEGVAVLTTSSFMQSPQTQQGTPMAKRIRKVYMTLGQ